MLNSKALIFLSIFIVLFVIIIGVFYEKIFDKDINILMQEEIDDIKAINIEQIPEKSDHFDVNIIIWDHVTDGRITFDVEVINPKLTMNEVIVSAYLNEKVLNYINTSRSLITNIVAVKNADKSFKEEVFRLVPNGEIKGISAGSTMVYFQNVTLHDVLEVIPYIVIKVSWLDDNKKPKVEYVKYKRDQYILKKI